MTSTDHEILISIQEDIRTARREIAEMTQTLSDIDRRIALAETKIDGLQTSVYWGFAIISFVVAFTGIFIPMLISARKAPSAPVQPVNPVPPQIIVMPPYEYHPRGEKVS